MDERQEKSILEMGRGAIMERADYEMRAMIRNILDPNTSAKAARKLNITLTFKPGDDRQTIVVRGQVYAGIDQRHHHHAVRAGRRHGRRNGSPNPRSAGRRCRGAGSSAEAQADPLGLILRKEPYRHA